MTQGLEKIQKDCQEDKMRIFWWKNWWNHQQKMWLLETHELDQEEKTLGYQSDLI